jgi:squalene-hopene/tetraprenyl-beta-curcumene cyclase
MKPSFTLITLLLLAPLIGMRGAEPVLIEKGRSPAPKPTFPHGSPDEPLRKELSLAKAAESLDRTAVAWVRKNKCGSCHTGWPYVSSRALLLKEAPVDSLVEVRAFFEARITNWDADEQVKKHQHREIVGTAAALAMHDAQTTGKLHSVTRQSLDRMWTLQRKDGAWSWPKCSWPPFEVDDYYGAVLAAVGVGHAPENYARSDAAKAGVDKLCGYLKKTAAPNLHHRAWLLWAAVRLDGLLDDEEKQSAIRDLLALQHKDGGWSMESLGPEWTGREGEKANPNAPSDGYGTGLVVFVLREAGLPPNHEALQRGVKWLSTNQRESGRWFTRSLNGVPQHFISDTATVFAVLALKACE